MHLDFFCTDLLLSIYPIRINNLYIYRNAHSSTDRLRIPSDFLYQSKFYPKNNQFVFCELIENIFD